MEVGAVIYAIKNVSTGQLYIGSAINFHVRKRNHLSQLRRNCHHCPRLQNSYNKYGKDCFEFSILESNVDRSDLIVMEQYYIDNLKPCFNTIPAAGSHLGAKRTSETCKKISVALTGKKLSQEHKEKVRQANLGKRYSEETKTKKSNSMKEYYRIAGNSAKQLNGLKKAVNATKKAVVKLDKDTGQILQKFESFEDAAVNVGLTSGECISRVVNGKATVAAGYKWRLL